MAFNTTNPKTTINIGVSSSNISTANISAYCSFTANKRGSLTDGLDVSTGVQRFTPGQTGSTKIIEADNVTADKNGFIYLKNLATTVGHECVISYGGTSVGNVPPGAAVLLPYDGNNDVTIVCASAGATQEIEFLHILEDTTY